MRHKRAGRRRESRKLIFDAYAGRPPQDKPARGRIGFNRSFLTNTYYPLYSTFFAGLGYEPVLADICSQSGIEKKNAGFCYPGELAHGFFAALLEHNQTSDYLFLPHLKTLPNDGSARDSQTCPLVQGEPFYLQSAFRPKIDALRKNGLKKILTPLVDLTDGLAAMEKPLCAAAREMGIDRSEARKAFRVALQKQQACFEDM
ncbi:MAG TPA: acyl-CoA dehydratase activase-related protein, partial [Smithellaceae bacterium]|nr:acyl-CoA dehydratase activase-related protein [Smithellaceae bacterium]